MTYVNMHVNDANFSQSNSQMGRSKKVHKKPPPPYFLSLMGRWGYDEGTTLSMEPLNACFGGLACPVNHQLNCFYVNSGGLACP